MGAAPSAPTITPLLSIILSPIALRQCFDRHHQRLVQIRAGRAMGHGFRGRA
jgi:hypothetical protein